MQMEESDPLDGSEVHLLEAKLQEIENSIKHLKRSNKELADFLSQSDENDSEFRDAINENIVVILRNEQIAIELRAKMGKAGPVEVVDGAADDTAAVQITSKVQQATPPLPPPVPLSASTETTLASTASSDITQSSSGNSSSDSIFL
jgi:hypothetical protein